jgi:parallel beta-helix repeat protein
MFERLASGFAGCEGVQLMRLQKLLRVFITSLCVAASFAVSSPRFTASVALAQTSDEEPLPPELDENNEAETAPVLDNVIGYQVFIPHIGNSQDKPPTAPVAVNAPSYSVIIDKSMPVLLVSGAGQIVTLPQIAADSASVPGLTGPVLVNEGSGVWRLTHRLRIGAGVTLRLASDTVSWLKLRSDASGSSTSIDRLSFIYLDTIDGAILIQDSKVTSWDAAAGTFDTTPKNGRAYLRATGAARLDVIRSEIGHLGSPEGGGSYGLSWRDEAKDAGGALRARVSGDVLNSDIHHNYYGIYTYAASNMNFRFNKFRDSFSYGFDPHDFSRDTLVEDNEAFNNGNHGFIISRGCHNFTFRRNKSYSNVYRVDSKSNRAHGFMLDPGGLTSTGGPYAPSYGNLLEFNEAYNNQGYGFRMLDTLSNTVRNNIFRNNLRGITVERNSSNNTIENNTIANNTEQGVQLTGDSALGHANNNRVTGNTFTGNLKEAVQIAKNASRNTIQDNTITANPTAIRATDTSFENTWSRNTVTGTTSISRVAAVSSTSNRSVLPPGSLSISGLTLSGRAEPNAQVEVFSAANTKDAQFFEGAVQADASGIWSLTISGPWRASYVTASQTVAGKGSSAYTTALRRP